MLIDDVLGEWLADVALRPRTAERYRLSFKVAARFGITTVEQLARARVRTFIRDRRLAGVTVQTCRRDLAAFQSLMRWLEELGRATAEQVLALHRFNLRTPPRPPIEFLTAESFAELVAAAADIHDLAELAVVTAACTGARLGELRALRVEAFSLDGPEPFVAIQGTKAARSIRTAAIAPSFARWLRPRLPDRGWLFPARAGWLLGRPSSTEFLSVPTLQRWMGAARRASGVRATWNILRHTYGTWMASRYHIQVVARSLGNTVRVAEQHYCGRIPGGAPDADAVFAEPLAKIA